MTPNWNTKLFNQTTAILILLLLFIGSSRIGAQMYQVSGRIIDAETGAAVETATVYMDGTSIGTITDSEGNFTLEGVSLPGRLIVSHVSYQLTSKNLDDPAKLVGLELFLNAKVVLLGEATIIHDQLRAEYVRRFKKWFLGMDYESYKADILNDSVLIFNATEKRGFTVQTTGPILVSQPHTGYTIKIDLVAFSLTFRDDLGGFYMSLLGYFFFDPISPGSPREQRSIARNRVQLFYNSGIHFCRSLYNNRLMENGYLFQSTCQPIGEDRQETNFLFDMKADYMKDQYGHNLLHLTGFTCDVFRIEYYHNAGHKPADLTFQESRWLKVSGLQFLKDTVRIHPTGRVAENSMLFSGEISKKGVASMLPDDYIPSMR